MLVSTPDHDELVTRYTTPEWTATRDKYITVSYSHGNVSARTHVFPGLVLRCSMDSPIHPMAEFFKTMKERCVKKRIALVLVCPDRDVCRLVHEFLGPDEHDDNASGKRKLFIDTIKMTTEIFCEMCRRIVRGPYRIGRMVCYQCKSTV